jgi:hypothetical protein
LSRARFRFEEKPSGEATIIKAASQRISRRISYTGSCAREGNSKRRLWTPNPFAMTDKNKDTELVSTLSVLWDRDCCRTTDVRYPSFVRCARGGRANDSPFRAPNGIEIAQLVRQRRIGLQTRGKIVDGRFVRKRG